MLAVGIEHRGPHATGVAWRTDTDPNTVHIQKRDKTASEFIRQMSVARNARTAIIHTRFWTQGKPENNLNNHPISTGGIIGVHNGSVHNDDELFRSLPGVPRYGEVDSEAIFATIAYGSQHYQNADHVVRLLEEVEGSAAIAWLDVDEGVGTLHLARLSTSPLVVAQTDQGSVLFASEWDPVHQAVERFGLVVEWASEVTEGTYYRFKDGVLVEVEAFTPNPGWWTRATWADYRTKSKYTVTRTTWDQQDDDDIDVDETTGWCESCKDYYCDHWVTEYGYGYEVASYNTRTYDPFLNPDYFDLNRAVPLSDDAAHSRFYESRDEAIEEWLENLDELEDSHIREQMYLNHVDLREGHWVRTEVMGQSVVGQVITMPKTFPSGNYYLRVFIQNGNGLEVAYVRRTAKEFVPMPHGGYGSSAAEEAETEGVSERPALTVVSGA